MNILAFDENVRRQIRNVVDYANLNIYQVDDILDMMNRQMAVPGERSGHLILVPTGLWICYYLVNHPDLGLCHYFNFKPDASGRLSNKQLMEYVLNEFGIESPLLDKHISVENKEDGTRIVLPVS